MDHIDDKNALQDFLLDIECLDELLPWTGKFNLFDVLKISRTEIRHSNMLAWLLDPNENHGFGDSFLKNVLQRIIETDSYGKHDIFQILLSDMYSFSVYREWKNIDILLISYEEKILVAIENKVGAHEHSNQLNKYRKTLETEFQDYKRIYVFLTPDGEDPSDVENWDVLTYSDIVELLEHLCEQKDLQQDISLMIRNYIDVIRRDIVKDQELVEICNKIYNKHKKALDLIFENRTDGTKQISDAIKKALKKLEEEGLIVRDSDCTELIFRTAEMDNILPKLATPSSSWGTSHCYIFLLKIIDGRFFVAFELGGWNVPEDEKQTMLKIIDYLKPDDKRKEVFKYKRVYRTKWYDLNGADDLEAEAEKLVREAVNELKSIEDKIMEIIKKQ